MPQIFRWGGVPVLADYGWGHHGVGGWLVMGGFWLVVIVAVAVAAWGWRRPDTRPATPAREAEEILASRFARGEIDEAEYRSRRSVIRT